MFKKGARAPYAPLPIVRLPLPIVRRVPNNKNDGATKSMYSWFEASPEIVDILSLQITSSKSEK